MKKLRKIQALLLSLALLVPIACNGTAVSILNDTQAVSAPLNFDEAVVESVKKESDNPDRACEMINDIDDTATYEEALRTVLDGYYLESNTTSIESLEKSIAPEARKYSKTTKMPPKREARTKQSLAICREKCLRW